MTHNRTIRSSGWHHAWSSQPNLKRYTSFKHKTQLRIRLAIEARATRSIVDTEADIIAERKRQAGIQRVREAWTRNQAKNL